MHIEKLEVIHLSLFLLGPILMGVMVGQKISETYFPVGDDPGNWLKRAYACAGVTFPLWEENLISYPPVFPYLVYCTGSLLGDMVIALKLLTIISLLLIPITTGFFIYKISGKKETAIIGSFLVSFLPSLYEMVWWGAYPNLLAFAFMPLSMYFLVEVTKKEVTWKSEIGFWCFSALITLTHHLTSVAYVTTLFLTLFFLSTVLKIREIKIFLRLAIAATISISYLTYLIFTDYATYNPATVLTYDILEKLLWGFKSSVALFSLLLLALLGGLYLFSIRKSTTLIIVASWLVSPFSVYISKVVGVNLDIGRLILLSGQPLIVLATMYIPNPVGLIRINEVKSEGKTVNKNRVSSNDQVQIEVYMEKLVAILLLVTLVSSLLSTSVTVNNSAYEYYSWLSSDYGRYSMEEKENITTWIRENTSIEDIIVSEYHLGRWLESYGNRRTIFSTPLSTIAIQGEFERSLSAEAMMNSNHQVINGFFRIDDTPSISPTFAPLIYVTTEWGYDSILYMDESFIRFNLTRNGANWIEAPYDAPFYVTQILKDDYQTTVEARYETANLEVNRTITIRQLASTFDIDLQVKAPDDINLNDVEITFFLAWGKTPTKFTSSSNGFFLSSEDTTIGVEIDPKPKEIDIGKDYEFNQDRILVVVPLSGIEDQIHLKFINPSVKSHYPYDWNSSTKEIIKNLGAGYIILPKYGSLYKTLAYTSTTHQGEVLTLKDGHLRMVFRKAGEIWSEAPYNATIIYEKVTDGEIVVRETVYRTVALNITKTVKYDVEKTSLSYHVTPLSNETEMDFLEIPLWIPWNNQIRHVEFEDGRFLIISEKGSIEVSYDNKASAILEEDSVYKQLKVLIKKPSENNTLEINLDILPVNDFTSLETEYTEASRPYMIGGDNIVFSVRIQHLELVYETEHLAVFKI